MTQLVQQRPGYPMSAGIWKVWFRMWSFKHFSLLSEFWHKKCINPNVWLGSSAWPDLSSEQKSGCLMTPPCFLLLFLEHPKHQKYCKTEHGFYLLLIDILDMCRIEYFILELDCVEKQAWWNFYQGGSAGTAASRAPCRPKYKVLSLNLQLFSNCKNASSQEPPFLLCNNFKLSWWN